MTNMLKSKTIAIICVTAMGLSLNASHSHAGPIIDWLFGRNAVTVVNYPVALPTANACNPCAPQVQPVTVQYVPQTAYRTTMARVPTTVYRPVTTTDPCTGCPVVTMQPCTTYSYQAQRVPYTTYRPLLSSVTSLLPVQQVATTCNSCTTACDPCATACSSCPTTVASPIVGTSSGCSSCSSPAASYSSIPSTVQPFPGGAATIPEASSTFAPATTMPADQAPSLGPSGFQSSTSRNFSPMASETRSTSVSPVPLSRDSFKRTPANTSVKPLPDLDALDNTHDPVYDAPQLLDPQDKTAASPIRKSWNYSPVKLATASEEPTRLNKEQLVAPKQKQESKLDASGWRSISK